ncbi:uncharacterized protein LOC119373967 [Rhipicephalus sanguineus]|uniref:uncharacterized protein LOC119373967 n=1 Tax=Rhipicephalus sanguineus TaxID=34632 RepID=UPI001892F8C3|nr:uncharacterized protein LOC119373967 [Rhipicephalus sanguineus]
MTRFIEAGTFLMLMCSEWCIIQACKHNEHKVKCYRHIGVPGRLCPGVERWPCSGTRKRCACVDGTAQRWDSYCVPYRDCVFRTHNPEKLLSLKEDLVMVGTSTTIFNQGALKCFVSKQMEPVYYNYHRSVNYKAKVGGRWEDRAYDLKMITENYGEKIIAEEVQDRLPYGMDCFPVLHADELCIILARLLPEGKKAECTYWVRRSHVENRNWKCDFIFDEFCRNQAIVVHKRDECK